MHEACGLAHGQCTLRVAWPLLQASRVLDGVAQKMLYARKQRNGVIQNNILLLQSNG